jgi:phosphoribosyl-ATP pyrophosphohydrolase
MVLLAHNDIDVEAVLHELDRRFGLSGLEEKASRSKK